MRISVLDGSNYFKGLLLLVRKDKKVTDEERSMMKAIGAALGFEKKFVDNAVREILENRHISVVPPVFSSRELAEKFLKDGMVLAASDGEVHPHEKEWLYAVARSNGVEESWVADMKERLMDVKERDGRLEVHEIKVIY
jgi:hypothetical protein